MSASLDKTYADGAVAIQAGCTHEYNGQQVIDSLVIRTPDGVINSPLELTRISAGDKTKITSSYSVTTDGSPEASKSPSVDSVVMKTGVLLVPSAFRAFVEQAPEAYDGEAPLTCSDTMKPLDSQTAAMAADRKKDKNMVPVTYQSIMRDLGIDTNRPVALVANNMRTDVLNKSESKGEIAGMGLFFAFIGAAGLEGNYSGTSEDQIETTVLFSFVDNYGQTIQMRINSNKINWKQVKNLEAPTLTFSFSDQILWTRNAEKTTSQWDITEGEVDDIYDPEDKIVPSKCLKNEIDYLDPSPPQITDCLQRLKDSSAAEVLSDAIQSVTVNLSPEMYQQEVLAQLYQQ